MADKVDERTETVKIKEYNVPLFEKRITLWACTCMLAFICSKAVTFQNDFAVLTNELSNAVKIIEAQNTRIERNTLKIAQHDIEIAVIKQKSTK